MSIRLKLMLTYGITVLLSAGILVFLFISIIGGAMAKVADTILEDTSFDQAAYEVIDLLAEIKQAQDYQPERLVDMDFIREINERLLTYDSGLIVYHKGNYLHDDRFPEKEDFYKQLVYYDYSESHQRINSGEDGVTIQIEKQHDTDRSIIEGDGYSYFYLCGLYEVNGEEVIYFILIDVLEIEEMNFRFLKFLGFIVLLLVLILFLPLIRIIQKDIMKPLRELDRAAKHISEGDLEFTVKTGSRNEVGRVLYSYETMRKELKRSIEKQVAYENNRKEFISSISHDLKTPMTSIKGYVEGILDGVANTDEKRERYLQVIHQKSLDMEKLIDDLFLLSKMDLQKLPMDLRVVDLEAYIQELISEWEFEYQNEALVTYSKFHHAPGSSMAIIDPDKLKRALTNIVQNGLKYNRSLEKSIQIRFLQEEEVLRIEVEDNGIGMTQEVLEKAFDMFYRSEHSRNSSTGGSGLGLAIAKQFIEAMGGKLYGRSVVDQGSIFVIDIKREKDQ